MQTDRQSSRKIDGRTDKQTDRQAARQTNRHTYLTARQEERQLDTDKLTKDKQINSQTYIEIDRNTRRKTVRQI